jgi:hypothetical protein
VSTFNGLGTMYYGWRHQDDGTATATKWFVVVWVPVVPLARYRLRVVTDFQKKEPFMEVKRDGFLAGAAAVQRTEYQLLQKVPLVLTEVLSTYVWTYLVGPILMAWPVLVFWALDAYLNRHPQFRQENWVLYVGLALAVLLFANPIAIGLIALRKARGFQGRVFE